MAMVYQKGRVFEKGKRIKKWYGQFRVYRWIGKERRLKRLEKLFSASSQNSASIRRRRSLRKSFAEKMARPDRLFRSYSRMMRSHSAGSSKRNTCRYDADSGAA